MMDVLGPCVELAWRVMPVNRSSVKRKNRHHAMQRDGGTSRNFVRTFEYSTGTYSDQFAKVELCISRTIRLLA